MLIGKTSALTMNIAGVIKVRALALLLIPSGLDSLRGLGQAHMRALFMRTGLDAHILLILPLQGPCHVHQPPRLHLLLLGGACAAAGYSLCWADLPCWSQVGHHGPSLRVHVQVVVYQHMKLQAIKAKVASQSKDEEKGSGGSGGHHGAPATERWAGHEGRECACVPSIASPPSPLPLSSPWPCPCSGGSCTLAGGAGPAAPTPCAPRLPAGPRRTSCPRSGACSQRCPRWRTGCRTAAR